MCTLNFVIKKLFYEKLALVESKDQKPPVLTTFFKTASVIGEYLGRVKWINCFFFLEGWRVVLQINIIPLPVTMNRKIKKTTGQIKFLAVTIK